ncbi:hypothetical protein AC630_09460 [Bradyrhizobium sp. AS23.2]|nr:hypothetical protein AC630_09460 [Bradyrhizobium sp. AS23.2]
MPAEPLASANGPLLSLTRTIKRSAVTGKRILNVTRTVEIGSRRTLCEGSVIAQRGAAAESCVQGGLIKLK